MTDRDPRIDRILAFWFGSSEPPADAALPDGLVARWFTRDAAFDADIDARFGALTAEALRDGLGDWCASPEGWLALLIALDQFPRNLYRDDPRAFAGDARAQALALQGLARGDDARLAPVQRVFAYLPLEHAEDAGLQARSVTLFEALEAAAPAAQADAFAVFSDYARAHRDVIERFGRFPHRNAVLGRESSRAERDWLEAGGGF